MKTVYLVRHGESTINFEHASTVLDDTSPLSPKGREQARAVAERCEKIHFDALIASPQVRARETAMIINEPLQMPIVFSDLFTERVLPPHIAGKTRAEAASAMQEWSEAHFQEGDIFRSFVQRAKDAFRFLDERSEQSILVVTHGFFLRTMLAHLLLGESLTPASLKQFIKGTRTENTGVTVLTYGAMARHAVDPGEERWMLQTYNDHAHLG